ncbi:MAG: hypothetical protein WC470_00600 [Candidatus Paceibacterota bacterium]
MFIPSLVKRPGFLRITESGILVWFAHLTNGKHVVVACAQVPEKPTERIYEQIQDHKNLILSNPKEETLDCGYILDCFDLQGSGNNLNRIYLLKGNNLIRVLENGDGRFRVQNWGSIPGDVPHFEGDSILGIKSEMVTLYNGLDEVEKFGYFGKAIFFNEAGRIKFRKPPQRTLADVIVSAQ